MRRYLTWARGRRLQEMPRAVAGDAPHAWGLQPPASGVSLSLVDGAGMTLQCAGPVRAIARGVQLHREEAVRDPERLPLHPRG